MLQRYLLILLSFGLPIASMQPQKSTADQLAGAAGANNLKGLNFWIKTQKENPNIYNSFGRTPLNFAAGNGQLEAVQYLLDNGAQPDFKDRNGLTPLAWAVLILNKDKTLNDYLQVIKLLISRGANVNSIDNNGLTVLHNATRGGDEEIIKLLLDSGARNDINHEGAQEKGRTPLADAIRASRDAITHVDLENNTTATRAEFPKLLTEAITQLHKKEANKLFTAELIKIINLLKKYGARTDMADALGHKLDYYINEVQLVSDAERTQLLNALNLPVMPRTIKYTLADIPQAIQSLENLRDLISSPAVAQKISMVIWTLQEIQLTSNTQTQYDILRIAMALLSKVKEVAKTNTEYFTDLEDTINQIRTIMRDSALIVSKKVQAPAIRVRPITTTPITVPAQPKPAAAQPSAVELPQKTLYVNSMYIADLLNYSEKPATLIFHFKATGQNQKFVINAAKNKNVPTIQEVMRSGHPDAPMTIESFNQNVTLEIIPGDPTKSGKVTEVKKQIANSKEPIKYWRLSDVKQIQIVITETGEIKIVPVKKITIIDFQGK